MKRNRLCLFFCLILLMLSGMSCSRFDRNAIDREKLVRRHLPRLHEADPLGPFTVGNGKFAFTVDVTGLQTFPDFYEKGIPLATQSDWGWHTIPNDRNYSLEDAEILWDAYGRQVPYASLQNTEAGQWLRANPHRLNLGRIGFLLSDPNGKEITIRDLKNINQTADLWQGVIRSHFEIEGESVDVETACHPDIDQISVRIRSALLKTGRIGVRFDFPYGSTAWGKNAADWNRPEAHRSEVTFQGKQSAVIERTLDADRYLAVIQWSGDDALSLNTEHAFSLSSPGTDRLEFNAYFLKSVANEPAPSATETFAASKAHWRNFWETGGAVDLSQSKDSRAQELERRIVLSQYLTAVQCRGLYPPAETGLTFNSWYGKFHLEMHWWHGVHFALWGRPEVLENSLAWYRSIMPRAKETAVKQGYEGVRWPKMVSVDGREGPSTVGVFLVWQQPHPIYYAELLYRRNKDQALLEKYRDIVFATADFMASFPHWDEDAVRYNLGPPLIPAQEIYKPAETVNPTFELAYWKYGLETAQLWRERLGLPRIEKWDHILRHLPALPQKNKLYQNAEMALDTFEDAGQRRDHPTLLGAFGMLPGDSVDVAIMRNTLEKVMQSWNWQSTWGWDYPMIAMTAARVGEPEMAIKALMMDAPKNRYLNNGHNYQDDRLPVYLPGNGGLLTAVAMMAAGWDGAPDVDAPGFPKDGNWVVRHEGLYPLP